MWCCGNPRIVKVASGEEIAQKGFGLYKILPITVRHCERVQQTHEALGPLLLHNATMFHSVIRTGLNCLSVVENCDALEYVKIRPVARSVRGALFFLWLYISNNDLYIL